MMAYPGTAESGGEFGGDYVPRPPAGQHNPGMAELRKKLGSVELAPTPDGKNQELVDIIEAAESTIRTQMEESEQLRSALRVAEWELHTYKLDQQKQGASSGFQTSPQGVQRSNGSSRANGLKDGQAGSPGMVPRSEYQNGASSSPGDAPSYAQQNGLTNGGSNGMPTKSAAGGGKSNGPPALDTGSFSQLSNASSRSVSPRTRRRETEADLRRDSNQGQGSSLDMPDTNNHTRSQDMMVRSSRPEDDDSNRIQLRGRLMDASIKEAQLTSEKRILERRVAELRLAYDQQQQGLVDAASKALSYRQDILEENIRLTYALQVAEQERTTYVQSLMPLLAEFDLQPPVSDAHSMVSHIKILVQKLRSELELYESKVKDSQFYPQSYQPPYQPASSYNPPPQSPPFQGNGMEIVPSYSQRPISPAQRLRHGGPSWESGVSSPHYPGVGEDNMQHAGSTDQETHADARAIVPHESMESRANGGFSDLDGDELPFNNQGDTDLEAAPRSPPMPPLPEEPTSPGFEDGDPLPGIVGLRIVGDAILSGRLTACGHSMNGTALCIFQWVRHYQNGTASYIEGAAQPEYTITADDYDSMVAIECVPMDERGRRGDLVTVMANDGNWITRDSNMQDQIDSYITTGHASFELNVLIQEGTSDDISEPATLLLRRNTWELRRNSARKPNKYTPDVSITIPVGQLIQCVINTHDGKAHFLELRDPRTRDTAVLTFRAFQKLVLETLQLINSDVLANTVQIGIIRSGYEISKSTILHGLALDEQKKKNNRRKWLRG